MAVKSENTRITITLPKELLAKVETLAEYQHVTKNAVVVSLIQMSIDAQLNMWALIKNPDTLQKMVELYTSMRPEDREMAENVRNVLTSERKEDKDKVDSVNELFDKIK